ncbi:small membrane protein [Klebsiella aerogenes]|nr:small membrane protein [Klebsiella aerogenes]HBV4841652.1 small membrane protein [Klebsiella aerogenes]
MVNFWTGDGGLLVLAVVLLIVSVASFLSYLRDRRHTRLPVRRPSAGRSRRSLPVSPVPVPVFSGAREAGTVRTLPERPATSGVAA